MSQKASDPKRSQDDADPVEQESINNLSVPFSVPDPLIESDEPSSVSEAKLAELVSELTDRMQKGLPIEIHEVCKQNPEHASDLMYLWGTVLVADAVGTAEAKAIDAAGASKSDSKVWQMALPSIMGDYQLIEEVGRGGMGIVYRAIQLSLNREVAIKMILRDRLASQLDRQRFFAEAKATAKLDHPGIVPVYDVGEIDGRPYFAMKYIRGKTLSELMLLGGLSQRLIASYL